jgi:integrase
MLTDHIKPAALRAGIGKVGWHTFRHTFSSLLHQTGTKLAVQKELLRHADIQTTMNIYTQAVSADKREAVQRVVRAPWMRERPSCTNLYSLISQAGPNLLKTW